MHGLNNYLFPAVGWSHRHFAMALTDSEPNFRSRASSLGIADAVVDSLCGHGINTLAKYAFSSSYVPGNSDETPFTNALQAALGRAPTVGELASLRRLYHEAYGLTSAELKSTVERTEDAPIKKLAQPERADRLKRQQARLKGVRIEGKLEPSDRLCDLANAMYEENRLHYIEISKCTSKEQEVLCQSQKDDKHVSVDQSGNVRVKDKENKLDADLSTDMLTRLAFMRRGLALDQSNILDYLEHDRWIERLFDCKVSSQPEGYARISMQQLINADRKLFVTLAELTRAGIQTTAAGRPADNSFKAAMDHPDVLHLLQPLPQSSSAGTKRVRDPDEPAPSRPSRPQKGKGRGKGKNSPGQSMGSTTIKMPAGLEEGQPGTKGNNPICFDYNLGGCKLPVFKGRCKKGLHVCCFKGCFQHNHTYQTCPQRKAGH